MGASTLNKKELFRLHMGEVKNDYATLMGDCEYYESQIESLQDENDKLRELLTTILNESNIDKSCVNCDLCEECASREGRWKGCLFNVRVEEKAKELGIEVEG